jgi:predicted permease
MKEKDEIETQMLAIGPNYFETMRFPLIAGRAFTASDMTSTERPAIINDALARKFPAGINPLGQIIVNGDRKLVIVGVAANAKYADLREPADKPTVYITEREASGTFALRTAIEPTAVMAAATRIVNETDDNLPIVKMQTQSAAIDRLIFNERLVARLSSLFGALALVLTCLGLYGLLAYEVARGTREIGIRMALGAQTRDVLRGVLLRGAALALVGAAAGMLVAAGVTRYIESMLYGVKPIDGVTFACVAALLLVVALAACWIPARRAMRVDPMVALRYE